MRIRRVAQDVSQRESLAGGNATEKLGGRTPGSCQPNGKPSRLGRVRCVKSVGIDWRQSVLRVGIFAYLGGTAEVFGFRPNTICIVDGGRFIFSE